MYRLLIFFISFVSAILSPSLGAPEKIEVNQKLNVSINASITDVYVKMKPGTSYRRTITVNNTSSLPTHVQAYVWDLWYSGEVETYAPPGTYKLSASQWISVQPQKMTIPPMESGNFSMNIFVPAGASGGNYAVLFFDTTPPLHLFSPKKQDSEIHDFKIGIPTYIDVEGTSKPDITIKKFRISHVKNSDTLKTAFKIHNIGNVHVVPIVGLVIFSQSKKGVKKLSSKDLIIDKILLPDQEMHIVSEESGGLPPGIYTAILSVEYGHKHPKTVQYNFVIK